MENKHNYYFISLGGWCGTTISLRGNNLYKEALPFDHIRSTLIGIIDCFDNNFINFFPKKLQVQKIEKYNCFIGKYFSFYHHNLYDPNIINDFNRRIERLNYILNNTINNKIIFVRTITTNLYEDETKLYKKFITSINIKYPLLKFILVFIIPGQIATNYYKNIDNQTFIFTVNDTSNNNDNLAMEYKYIYEFILQNDLYTHVPDVNILNIKNGYNRFVTFNGIPTVIENTIGDY